MRGHKMYILELYVLHFKRMCYSFYNTLPYSSAAHCMVCRYRAEIKGKKENLKVQNSVYIIFV